MGRRSLTLWTLAVLLAIGGVPDAVVPARAAADPTLVAPGRPFASQYQPRTDGTTIVWFDTATCRIMGTRLADRQPFPIVTTADPCSFRDSRTREALFDIDDGVLVWSTRAGITAMNLGSGRMMPITEAVNEWVSKPIISGSSVVWAAPPNANGNTLFSHDLDDPREPRIIARSEPGWRIADYVLSEQRLAWVEVGDAMYETWRIRLRQSGATVAPIIAEGHEGRPFRGFTFAGDQLVYADGSRFGARDREMTIHLETGEQRRLVDQTGTIVAASDPRYIFLQGNAIPFEQDTILGYDLTTDSLFLATGGPGDSSRDAAKGMLTWTRGPFEAMSIHAAPVADLLPTARRPQPDGLGRDLTYFDQTGQSLAFGFKTFWEDGGGLPVFGFPLTGEFRQRNPDTAAWHTVQVFERQRFEYHPELAGTPYEVSLGRLGVEDARQRSALQGLWAFNPIAPTAQHPDGCRYLAATQHRLCGEFRPYWEGHGLDLGDAGVSEREALALFGYPISEEFIDPDTGLITQYFERAVFEYHAANPPATRVQLRRLGADRLAAIGWR